MEPRTDLTEFTTLAPAVRESLTALGKAIADSGLDKSLTELIKIRASQINGCAFCIQFHLNLARKIGLSQTKLDLLPVWREAGIYTPQESAALAWTEALTHLTPVGVSQQTYEDVSKQFTKPELAHLTTAIAHINAWNRIAMAYNFRPPISQTE
jgi:AhpD family alkylhydroperoxidase